MITYLICTTPRSGSTLLCEYLTLTGIAGAPEEWMLPINETWAIRELGITDFDDPRYLTEIIARTRTPNGVFGAKVMWPEMERLWRRGRWNVRLPGPASHALPNLHYIRVLRRDRIRQAISFFLAMRTNQWHRKETDVQAIAACSLETLEIALSRPETRAALLGELAERLQFIESWETEWDRFFTTECIAPYEVEYEQLVADPATVIRDILRSLGLVARHELDFSKLAHRRMSDGRNELLLAAWGGQSAHNTPRVS